ncbi:MAG: type II toxin-antitoxin system VapC family toxin [Actinomycetota bacterium]|nr:type II toxin-antitoxin system VapC family toxin [Actinomycetota bacterium]
MILVDTSVWVDHLRAGDELLTGLLQDAQVLGHPWVTGEIALGSLAQRREVVGLLQGLPQAVVASDSEVLALVGNARLFGRGIGWVDAQLLASTRLVGEAVLWTRDRRLADAAAQLGVGANL